MLRKVDQDDFRGCYMEKNRRKETCCGCGACAEVCPEGAIHMIYDREGFAYPEIDKSSCTGCGRCKSVCPVKVNGTGEGQNTYFGAQAKKKQLRYSSSSGGIFPVLAQYVIERGGIVYGAGYDRDMNVVHKGAENYAQLEGIKRTKYVQSNMEGIFSSIKKNLVGNRWVLFCGTPCQTQALILFLNKKYEKLITVDLVCYGVPSPVFWKKYVKFLEHKHRGKLKDFCFRDKRNVDNGHMRSYWIDGVEYVDSIYQDIYCKLYFKNYVLRPACYNCKFCTVNRNSDFTIGDFWGIERVKPELDDGMGTSLVIVHSDQARKIWEMIKAELDWFECERNDLLQPRLLEASRIPRFYYVLVDLYRIMPFRLIERVMNN